MHAIIHSFFSSSDDCSTNWKPLNTGCYNLIEGPRGAFQEAKESCEKIKGNLVEINTKEENDLIQKKLEKELLPGGEANARDSIWLGITRGDGNTWNYISGKQVNFIDLPWNTGEPNNSGGSEDCVSMFVGVGTKSDTSGGWNDESCGNTWPGTLCEVGDPRYRFLEGPISWDQAKKECEQFGWQLVEIDSKETNDAVVEEAKKRTDVGRIWIGLKYSPGSDKWVWISSGDEVGFSSWRPGEPNNVNGENCVEMFSTVSTPGTWNDLNCGSEDNNRGAICERPKPLVIQSKGNLFYLANCLLTSASPHHHLKITRKITIVKKKFKVNKTVYQNF